MNAISWLGIASPRWIYDEIAHRNMPILAVGSLSIMPLIIMLEYFLFAGLPSPIMGFDEAMSKHPTTASMFGVVCVVSTFVMLGVFVFAVICIRRKEYHPYISMALTVVFAFIVIMLIGIMISGYSHDRQLLLFASLCFLIAGLLVLVPIVSMLFFVMAFSLLGFTFSASGVMNSIIATDLVYLAFVDMIVSGVIYTLFVRYVARGREVADKSRRDELTGAKNRHYLRDDFSNYIGSDVYVLLCDVDNFKYYNDSFGHDIGDDLLKQFFFALREVFGDECTYRYGGDEFLVVSPEFGERELKKKLDRLEHQMRQIELEGEKANVTLSGGLVAGTAVNQDSFREMMHEADENLLEAKRQGKNRIIGL